VIDQLVAKHLSIPIPKESPVELPKVNPPTVLEQIHRGLYRVLLNAIKYGVAKKDRVTGKVTNVKASAKLMDIARQFQRDNSPEPHKLPALTEYFK